MIYKFKEYWRDKGHLGCDPEEVAELAWNAARNANQIEEVMALDLAVAIHAKHYRNPEWEPCDDIAGLISQIDNMVAGLERREDL